MSDIWQIIIGFGFVGILYIIGAIFNLINNEDELKKYLNSLPDDERKNCCGTCGCKLIDEEKEEK